MFNSSPTQELKMKFALLTSFCALGFSLAPKIVHASDYTLQLIPNCSSAISDNKNAVSLIQITESTEIGHFFRPPERWNYDAR